MRARGASPAGLKTEGEAHPMDLGLEGWVGNAGDGSVRCVAEGLRERLETLLDRLRDGPVSAIVDRVSVAWMPATGTLGPFSVRSGGHRGD